MPIEIVFDQGFGDPFVTRVAGNVAGSEIIGSLEFGTRGLGAKVPYVLGRTACGAVSATLRREPIPGRIGPLFRHILPAVRLAGADLEKAVRENVRLQAMTLAESCRSSPSRLRTVRACPESIGGYRAGAVRPGLRRPKQANWDDIRRGGRRRNGAEQARRGPPRLFG